MQEWDPNFKEIPEDEIDDEEKPDWYDIHEDEVREEAAINDPDEDDWLIGYGEGER